MSNPITPITQHPRFCPVRPSRFRLENGQIVVETAVAEYRIAPEDGYLLEGWMSHRAEAFEESRNPGPAKWVHADRRMLLALMEELEAYWLAADAAS